MSERIDSIGVRQKGGGGRECEKERGLEKDRARNRDEI